MTTKTRSESPLDLTQAQELILQSLEHELGGVKIYATALECAIHPELKKEWTKYHAETETHVEALERVCKKIGIDSSLETPGRKVVRHNGQALVEAMRMALAAGKPEAAQIVAAECVVLAETKDHADWQLLGKCAEYLGGEKGAALKEAYDAVEDEEDSHLYHSKGWCRELWLESLGLNAVLPPPEETKDVKTAIAAAKAEQSAEKAR
jgi:ferritin-like metal-binding protein YciE